MAEAYTRLYRLTKSRYLSGVTCLKKLWKDVHEPIITSDDDPATAYQKHVGSEIGELARQGYTDGQLVDDLIANDCLLTTEHLIAVGRTVLFEPAFLFDEVYVRADIIEKNRGDNWSLIEVKSGVDVKPEYLDDLAIQYYVLHGSGLRVSQVRLRFLNRDCRYPDLSDLFIEQDVTSEVLERQDGMATRIAAMKSTLDGPVPELLIGQHCEKPYECNRKSDCWSHVPDASIFQIPNLRWDKKNDLIKSGILAVSEIPPSFKVSPAQHQYVERIRSGTPVIDRDAIHRKLNTLTYPLYFLDFETDSAALPRFEGCGPYEQVPYQFSCHVLSESGELRHEGYLHPELSDPRRKLSLKLLDVLGSNGTIVSYNANFEKRVIKALADSLPGLKDDLLHLLDRFWDQLDVFRQDYFHPAFGGSNSIKSVLPAIVPQLSYKTLDIVHKGTEAGAVWNRAIREDDSLKRENDLIALWEYCKLDTLAMVEIHRHLVEVCTT